MNIIGREAPGKESDGCRVGRKLGLQLRDKELGEGFKEEEEEEALASRKDTRST